MKRTNSSKRWLQEHFDDIYVKKAHAEGKRSRAVYKLKEIDDKEHLFKHGMTIVDLGSAPGGWAQYLSQKLCLDDNASVESLSLAGRKTNNVQSIKYLHNSLSSTKIIALDILPMDPLLGVDFIQGDFREENVLAELMSLIPERSVDVLLSDMAPNMSGNTAVDIPRAMYLSELAFDFGYIMLKPGGTLLMKVFHGSGFDALVKQARQQFERVVIKKPLASRSRSRETYLLAKGYKL